MLVIFCDVRTVVKEEAGTRPVNDAFDEDRWDLVDPSSRRVGPQRLRRREMAVIAPNSENAPVEISLFSTVRLRPV
jgi:hypothetical protein